MKQEPIDEHAANEALPTKAERNYGVLTRRYRLGDRRNGNLLDFERKRRSIEAGAKALS